MTALTLEYNGDGYLTLSTEAFTLRVDPRLPQRVNGRGRQVPQDTTYVLATHLDREIFISVLDLLDETDAVLIASPDICRQVLTELPRLPEDRWIDLDDWERASSGHMRVTAFSLSSGSMFNMGALSPERLAPNGLRNAVSDTARNVTNAPMRLLDSLSQLGEALAAPARALMPFGMGTTGPSMGYLLDLDHGPTVALFGLGLIGSRPDLEWLDDIAELADIDILLAAAEGERVEALVWGTRLLSPEVTLLYRQSDPYDPDRTRPAVPIQRFMEAIEEDSPEVEVDHLRPGDGYVTNSDLGTDKASAEAAG